MIEPSSVKISAFDGNLVDKLQAVSGQAQAIKKQRQMNASSTTHQLPPSGAAAVAAASTSSSHNNQSNSAISAFSAQPPKR